MCTVEDTNLSCRCGHSESLPILESKGKSEGITLDTWNFYTLNTSLCRYPLPFTLPLPLWRVWQLSRVWRDGTQRPKPVQIVIHHFVRLFQNHTESAKLEANQVACPPPPPPLVLLAHFLVRMVDFGAYKTQIQINLNLPLFWRHGELAKCGFSQSIKFAFVFWVGIKQIWMYQVYKVEIKYIDQTIKYVVCLTGEIVTFRWFSLWHW